MKILLNGLVVGKSGGHYTYFRNLLSNFGRLAPRETFVLLHAPWQSGVFDYELPANVVRLVQGPSYPGAKWRLFFEKSVLPGIIRELEIDVSFSPTPATWLRLPCARVIAVRNSNLFSPLSKAGVRYWIRNLSLRQLAQYAINKAERAIFVSQYSRAQALKVMKVKNPDTVKVIHHGVGEHFFHPTSIHIPVIEKLTRPYILTVSTLSQHKNYIGFLDAYSRILSAGETRFDYVVVGKNHGDGYYREFLACITRLDLKDRVHYLGELPYIHLPALYQRAHLFVFPSFLETFGHPVVEAMASGLPVVASHAAAIPEIAGDAAVYFDPYDVDNMAATVLAVLSNDGLLALLRKQGRNRARQFSWARATEKLLAVFEEAYSQYLSKSK